MVATMHKVAAGNGYQYYLRNTAANDTSARGRASLAEYYDEHGEAPGTWRGSGLSALDLHPSAQVREEQMRNLFGEGIHPDAEQVRARVAARHHAAGMPRAQAARMGEKATRLGNRYPVYTCTSGYRAAKAQAYRDYNTSIGVCTTAPIPDDVRAQISTRVATEMFTAEYERAPLDARELSGWVVKNSRPDRSAVAGYDFTFSPVKSVSALWAIASPDLAGMIAAAHRHAVTDALTWLESEALFTRLGRNGIRQVQVQGAIAATFDHRDSRANDPDLHTHVLIANRVRTTDGKWRTIDGTTIHEAVVTVSEIYDTRLEHHLETALGLRFADRLDRDPDQVRVREIVGIPLPLIQLWSQRGAAITDRLDTLTAAWQAAFGREPEPGEVHRLAQRATLETRPRKHLPGSRAQQRALWRAEATALLGSPDAIHDIITHVLSVAPVARPAPDDAFIARVSAQALAAVSGKRATWREFNLRAEVERQLRGEVAPADWARVTAQVCAHALAPTSAVARGDPDLAEQPELRAVPAWLRRDEGTPVHTRANSQIYTTASTLAAEAELIALAVEPGGRILDPGHVAVAVHDYDTAHPDQPLNPGQVRVIESFAAAGMRMHTANAPAGTGKTTAMAVLSTAWRSAGGTVLGLAPTANAAAELGQAIGARAETVDKLLHVLSTHHPDALTGEYLPHLPQWVLDITDTTLVILDEHVTVPTTKRLHLLRYLTRRGATVRCLGDDRQLPSIDAGGAAADMAHAAPQEPVTLTEVVRFASRGEALASKGIRVGDPLALAWYLDHGRIHAGHLGSVYEDTYQGWATDTAEGAHAVMLAPTRDIVTALNLRARAERLAHTGTHPGPDVLLGDGLLASAGDTVRTRRNDPRLRLGTHDWVRNGHTWTIRQVHPDGAVTVTRRVHGRDTPVTVRLPAEYVVQHLHLGYAATIDSAQGITADTCHIALSGRETRQQFYVAMTRGRHANHAYLATAMAGEEGEIYTLPAHYPRTAVEHLHHILDRDGTATSAHTELRDALDPARRIGRAVDTYLDTLALTAEHTCGPERLATIDHTAEQLLPGLTDSPAYPVLRQHLAMLTLAGTDPITALRTAITARELATATDPAAVLDWRLDPTGAHSTGPGPLPWTPGLPTNTADTIDPETLAPVRARQHIVTELANQISDTTRTWTTATAPRWARNLLQTPELVADLAIWRAGLHIPDTDHRPTGPTRHTTIERNYQQQLQRRILDNDSNTQLPQHLWATTVDRINPRISTDPTWPVIANHIDTAARAGIDIEHQITHAAQQRPLPDDMPAAALWTRLEIDPNDLPTPHPDSHTTPAADHNPDAAGQSIADAINAADLGHHTENADDYSTADQYNPYQPQPDTGHDIDW
ncbi:MobF family relaxase [Nocardia brasiliensis]|uniref:MobF family relaxase n=1 Tax=Nocardia brasiliensis TaxID=37326 RepID=UPI0018957039|nr:MobF family relaxase [Nocardia brasiliensis]MBF6543377.1 relaxase domain-containing protein [Nocardia brasiliensis]